MCEPTSILNQTHFPADTGTISYEGLSEHKQEEAKRLGKLNFGERKGVDHM
jgi:hypothetical protein